jgi:hypothetical protein
MTNKCTLSPLSKETRRRQEPVVDDNKSASEGDSDQSGGSGRGFKDLSFIIGQHGPSWKKLLHQPVVKASILMGFGNG